MYSIIKKISLLFVVIWVTGCAQTSVRHHQDFEEVAKTIDSVVIIPVDVEVELITFDGDNELLEEKSMQIREQIHALVASKLQGESLKVIDFDFNKEIAANEDFAYAITQAKEAWEKSKEDMYKLGMVPEKEKSLFQTNLGSVLNIVAEKTGADAAVLMHYQGYEKSSGMIAKDLASSVLIGVLTMGAVVPVQSMEGSFIDVALIDTTSGKVIWANRKAGASVDISSVDVAFKELPDLTWKSELTNNVASSDNSHEVETVITEGSPDNQ